MSKLPPDLSPWSAQLEALPLDLALALGPWLKRLALAIGPMRSGARGREGEVDGFDGLTSRGGLEHLLASEWLLASEIPDEFLRRAVEGELAFLSLARREPAGGRRSFALFDSGPDQLGAPRLAHLALAIILARRATAAGAEFAWGIAQWPQSGLCRDTSEAAWKRLLSGRTSQMVSRTHLEAWQPLLSEMNARDDLWLIGALTPAENDAATNTRRRCFPGASLIEIEQTHLPDKREVSLRVRPNGSSVAQELELELPAERQCIRLLRDPFATASAPLTSSSGINAGVRGMLISHSGRRIFLVCNDGSVANYPIPSSPRQKPGHPTVVPGLADELIVGLQYTKKRAFILTANDERLRIRSRAQTLDYSLPVDWQAPSPQAAPNACWHRRLRGGSKLLFRDGGTGLYALEWELRGTQPELVMDNVVAMTSVSGTVHAWRYEDNSVEHFVIDGAAKFVTWGAQACETDLTQRTVWVTNTPGGATAVAFETEDCLWLLVSAGRDPARHAAPAGAHVHGLTWIDRKPHLVAIAGDRRTLILTGPDGERTTEFMASDTVDILHVPPHASLLAYCTVNGHVEVIETGDLQALLRLAPTPT
ncbi:MAG: hypothetical protein ACR2RL_05255 [Gammaproteobacteria bacterium]